MQGIAQIRNEISGPMIVALAGTETRTGIGSVFPCDGDRGGWLYVSSPNAWVEWFITTTQNHVDVIDAGARTGPASWSAIRLDSGANITFNVKAVETLIVNQDTGIRTTTPITPNDIAVRFWFQPGVESRTPIEVYPLTAGVTPQADFVPIPAGATFDVGYTPRLTRFAMISAPLRLNAQAIFPGGAVHGQEQIAGPNDGDSTFYLGPWSLLRLQNAGLVAVPCKILWSQLPGAHQ